MNGYLCLSCQRWFPTKRHKCLAKVEVRSVIGPVVRKINLRDKMSEGIVPWTDRFFG